ncbi:uncharacterized protein BXZ73DRAFT_101306 [Epithele typhae]|uniref:uncharacterized protein n=1 Tax=Epithele typhae TaxID=378194 RepID=UPI002008A84F|nr:uncharacterized protein BXZ73DRAFT_101306 [Epithele typhae]KAH9932768.1 hypothetical protein BXZ73DRAFT_101306 [Epithele typhae]
MAPVFRDTTASISDGAPGSLSTNMIMGLSSIGLLFIAFVVLVIRVNWGVWILSAPSAARTWLYAALHTRRARARPSRPIFHRPFPRTAQTALGPITTPRATRTVAVARPVAVPLPLRVGSGRERLRPASQMSVRSLGSSSGYGTSDSGHSDAPLLPPAAASVSSPVHASCGCHEGKGKFAVETNHAIALGFLPIYHSYGLHCLCIQPQASVSTTVLLPRWDPALVFDLIPRHRINVLYLTPPAILHLLNHPRVKTADLSSVISLGSGASYLPPRLARVFTGLANNAKLVEGYGMSETTLSITRPCPEKLGGPKSGSPGILVPGLEARFVHDNGTLASPDEPGELWVRGDVVVLGYWGDARAAVGRSPAAAGCAPGTGPALLRRHGFVERVKDTLEVSGQQVSPTELSEAVLFAHPDRLVADVTVAAVAGARPADERVPRAWVVLSEERRWRGAAAAVRALEAWVRQSLSRFKWLRGGIEVVDEIPKNPTGKVLRRVLVERHEERQKALSAKL